MRDDLSIIVVTKNEEANLPRLLNSLTRNSVSPNRVIIVDAGSTDATPEIARSFGAQLLEGPPNLSAQRNIGIRAATTRWVMVIDADMELPEGYLDEVLALLESGQDCVILPENSIGKSFLSRSRGFERTLQEGDLTIEAARAYTTELFRRSGGYDEEIGFGGEDWFLAKSMYERTTPVRVRAKLLHHEGDPSAASIAKKYFFYGRGRYRLYRADRKRFLELTNPIRPSSRRHAGEYVRHPFMALGVVMYKCLTYACGLAGFAAEAMRRAFPRARR